MTYSRREALKLGAAAGAALLLCKDVLHALPGQEAQLMKVIPSSGERIPAVGLGTANTFMQAARTPDEHARIREVVRRFTGNGGRFIDTSPSYGSSEEVLGDLARDVGNATEILWATKVSGANGRAEGMAQVERSEERLAPGRIFLNQVHNLGDWQTQLPLLNELKQEGRFQYVGITSTSSNRYPDVERIITNESVDFLQVDYAIDNREVEERILPAAQDNGVAVITALPFGRARLFARTSGQELPAFAHEIGAHSWAQFFLKYLLGNPAVTVVIPGTSNPDNLVDNMGAGRGPQPDAAMRRRLAAFIDSLPQA
jgi:aryl-alcohol dehydrogenase-like predicted oxidoreductase